MKPSQFVNGIGQKSCRKCKFYKMFTKIKQILRNRKIHRWGGKNLWIMWITWCITAKWRESAFLEVDNFPHNFGG